MYSGKIFKNAQDLPESTVQMNVTLGLVYELTTKYHQEVIPIGPSTSTEPAVGFDVAIQSKTTGDILFFLQYKAAKANSQETILSFDLDNPLQNQLMQQLKRDYSGSTKVFYALPTFVTVHELINSAGYMSTGLLAKVGWFFPTEINWTANNNTCTVTYDRTNGIWSNVNVNTNQVNVLTPYR